MKRPVIPMPKCIIRTLSRCGFVNIWEPNIFGDPSRLHMPASVSPMNTLFNTVSGEIWIGENTFFGHNCMILTGKHSRALSPDGLFKHGTIRTGYDVHIGEGCWIASGAMIFGGVTVGDNSIIAAGSIVTKDVPPGTIVKGTW